MQKLTAYVNLYNYNPFVKLLFVSNKISVKSFSAILSKFDFMIYKVWTHS